MKGTKRLWHAASGGDRLLSLDTPLPSQASLSPLYAAKAKTQLARLAPIIPTMNTGTISSSASSAAPVTLCWASRRFPLAPVTENLSVAVSQG